MVGRVEMVEQTDVSALFQISYQSERTAQMHGAPHSSGDSIACAKAAVTFLNSPAASLKTVRCSRFGSRLGRVFRD